jgi:hypothetical protein
MEALTMTLTTSPKQVLALVDDDVASDALAHLQGCRVFAVCPALNSRLRFWLSDEDAARREAERRLEATVVELRARGVEADGIVGDADPAQAANDGLRLFDADEIVVFLRPPGRRNSRERGLTERLRALGPVPVRVVSGHGDGRAPRAAHTELRPAVSAG